MSTIKATAIATADFALLALLAVAQALMQQAKLRLLNASTGTAKPAGKSWVRLSAYLATRDAASTRPQHQANPVGNVVVAFLSGSYITPSSTGNPVCKLPAGVGERILTNRANSKIGSGWALLNTGRQLGVGGTPLARP